MTESVQDPAWGVQMMAEGWSDAISKANARIAELEQEVRRLTVLERTASQHASGRDADLAEADHRLALAKAEIARLNANERRMYSDLLNRNAELEKRIDELEDAVEASVFGDMFAERDEAHRQVKVLQDRLAKVRERLGQASSSHRETAWELAQELLPLLDGEAMPRPVPEDWRQLMPLLDDEHPEKHCNRCGGPNVPSWCAPSPLWNQVMRGGDINGKGLFDGIVCPVCFAALAEEAGIAWRWRFYAEKVLVPLQTTTPSGRTWNEQTWLWDDAEGAEKFDD